MRRRRLEVAALRLLATPAQTALAIALDVGFGSAEVFTRAFKAHFGVTSLEAYGPELAIDPATGAFTCRLCLPVRPA